MPLYLINTQRLNRWEFKKICEGNISSFTTMQTAHCKRKPCADISNLGEYDNGKSCKYSAESMFPINENAIEGDNPATPVSFEVQNVHLGLARYQSDAKTEHMLYEDLLAIIDPSEKKT